MKKLLVGLSLWGIGACAHAPTSTITWTVRNWTDAEIRHEVATATREYGTPCQLITKIENDVPFDYVSCFVRIPQGYSLPLDARTWRHATLHQESVNYIAMRATIMRQGKPVAVELGVRCMGDDRREDSHLAPRTSADGEEHQLVCKKLE